MVKSQTPSLPQLPKKVKTQSPGYKKISEKKNKSFIDITDKKEQEKYLKFSNITLNNSFISAIQNQNSVLKLRLVRVNLDQLDLIQFRCLKQLFILESQVKIKNSFLPFSIEQAIIPQTQMKFIDFANYKILNLFDASFNEIYIKNDIIPSNIDCLNLIYTGQPFLDLKNADNLTQLQVSDNEQVIFKDNFISAKLSKLFASNIKSLSANLKNSNLIYIDICHTILQSKVSFPKSTKTLICTHQSDLTIENLPNLSYLNLSFSTDITLDCRNSPLLTTIYFENAQIHFVNGYFPPTVQIFINYFGRAEQFQPIQSFPTIPLQPLLSKLINRKTPKE